MAASASPSKTASIPFASKLAPTGIASIPHFPANPLNLWELACQRWRPLPHHPKPRRSHSRASSLPQGSHPSRTFRPTHRDRLHPALPAKQLNLWELACQRWRPLPHHPKPRRSHSRASSLPQGSHPCRTFLPTHRDRLHPALSCQTTEPVGASLLAKASVASPSSYCAGGAGSGSLVTRSNPHRPEVLPKAP